MSQFLYLQFKVTPKGSLAHAIGNETVAIELPTKHVTDWRIERPHLKLSDKEITIELTQPVAIATVGRFVSLTHRPPKGAGNPFGQLFTEASSRYE